MNPGLFADGALKRHQDFRVLRPAWARDDVDGLPVTEEPARVILVEAVGAAKQFLQETTRGARREHRCESRCWNVYARTRIVREVSRRYFPVAGDVQRRLRYRDTEELG